MLRSVSKCEGHRAEARDPATLDLWYYRELGVIQGSTLRVRRYVGQLFEALGSFPPAHRPGASALEVGCGISPYAGAIDAAGYRYRGLDPSPHAVTWMERLWPGCMACGTLEAVNPGKRFALILAAHVLEHVEDAPGAIRKLAGMLEPGGELWLIVPDDSDPVNPDHKWFFTEAALRAAVVGARLFVSRISVRKIIERENFIYLRAVRP